MTAKKSHYPRTEILKVMGQKLKLFRFEFFLD